MLSSDEDELFEQVDNNLVVQKVMKIIKNELDEREREIIILRYGLNGKRALTQKEVADKLGISRSYISRIENKALETIKITLDKYSETN